MSVSLRRLIPLATLVAAFAALPARALAAEADADSSTLSPHAELDVVSRYVWRTLTYSEGVVLQPRVSLSIASAEIGMWANAEPSGLDSHRLDEVVYSAAYRFGLGQIEAKPSVVLYTFPGLGDASTGELQLELRRAMTGGLSAVVRLATDFLDYPGASFTTAGLDREWDLTMGSSLTLSTQIGWGSQGFSDAYLPGGPALTVMGAAVSWIIPIARGWAVRPHIDWLEIVDVETRAMLPVHTPITFGVAFGRR